MSFLVLFWSLRDLIGGTRASLFGIILPFQVHLTSVFNIGVPDHHGILILLFSTFIAFIIRSILNGNRNTISISGILGGLSIWFGIESIVVVVIAFIVFGFAWVIEGKRHQNKNYLFSFFLLLTTLLTMFIDTRPDEILKVVYDRRSIVHVCLWLIATGFWVIIAFLSQCTQVLEKKIGRIIASTIGATACLLIMHELFPFFFKNPLSGVDPAIKLIYLNETSEFTGLFSEGNNLSRSIIAYWAMALPGCAG